jgi:subtilisin family serine protease
VVSARYGLRVNLPLKKTLIDTYAAYLAANKVDKPDIWAARSVELAPGRGYAPVRIAVWDSGLDSRVFQQLVRGSDGKPALIAFDLHGNPDSGDLYSLPAGMEGRLPAMRARTKGFSDLQSNVDSPEASEVKQYLSDLKPDEYKKAIEEISFAGAYNHGTHVAGIAVAGNPYAQLVNARIAFDHKLMPDPCPSRELVDKEARNAQSYVDFMKSNGVRVVNMSWSASLRNEERTLEQCGIGKTEAERKSLAREFLDIGKSALQKAFASAPGIVFVAAAGNANSDSTFGDVIPAGLSLPNLITVGAVDKAGDEASFTSYGSTVAVHANGYQVDSFIPGGDRVALSGTSMSAPQVANLAGKMLAVNPKLTPPK